MMRTRRAKTDPPGAAIGPSIVLEGEGALVVKTFALQGQYISILHFMWRLQMNASQNSVTFNMAVTIVIISIILITYQEERKIQAVTVMRVRMWATSPWGGHSSWYALDIRGLFSQYDIEKKESYKSPWLSNLKEYPSIYFCTCIA